MTDWTEHPVVRCVQPLIDAVGAQLCPPAAMRAGDIALRWEGSVIGAVRLPPLHGALDRLIEQVERELGGKLGDLSREDKQRAVRMLDDRGAFTLRRAVDDVSDVLGVSRITVYNYLNAMRND